MLLWLEGNPWEKGPPLKNSDSSLARGWEQSGEGQGACWEKAGEHAGRGSEGMLG